MSSKVSRILVIKCLLIIGFVTTGNCRLVKITPEIRNIYGVRNDINLHGSLQGDSINSNYDVDVYENIDNEQKLHNFSLKRNRPANLADLFLFLIRRQSIQNTKKLDDTMPPIPLDIILPANIFPQHRTVNPIKTRKFRITPCKFGAPICDEKEGLPSHEFMEELLASADKTLLKRLQSRQSAFMEPDVENSKDDPKEENLCKSKLTKVAYTKALSSKSNWVVVLQHGDIKQFASVEVCDTEYGVEQPCQNDGNVENTVCKQSYVNRGFIVINELGDLFEDQLQVASCCQCFKQ